MGKIMDKNDKNLREVLIWGTVAFFLNRIAMAVTFLFFLKSGSGLWKYVLVFLYLLNLNLFLRSFPQIKKIKDE